VEVGVLREESTVHVRHMFGDKERYWENVHDLWESANS